MTPHLVRIRDLAALIGLHVIPAVAVVHGTRAVDWVVCAVLYAMAGFVGGIGLHRYFAHRAFRTSRAFQLVLGVLACTAFTDPVGFAGKHRLHHRHADTERDVHGPGQGFWYSWFGSLLERPERQREILAMAADLAAYPELMWLHRYYCVPALALGAALWWLGGFSLFAIGFVLSRALGLHAVSALNYFCHRGGRRPYPTRDRSSNNAVIALLTFGEGWHNNHHRFPQSARAGIEWWEIDPVYWLIRLLAAAGLVWDVREPPGRRGLRDPRTPVARSRALGG